MPLLKQRGDVIMPAAPLIGSCPLFCSRTFRLSVVLYALVFLLIWGPGAGLRVFAGDDTTPGEVPNLATLYDSQRFVVQSYIVEGKTLLAPDQLAPVFSKHTGTNIDLGEIVKAAGELQMAYRDHGYTGVSVIMGPDAISNGVARMQVVNGVLPQIVIAGKRYPFSTEATEASDRTAPTNSVSKATPAGAAPTNATPHLSIQSFEVTGNHLLSQDVLQSLFAKHTGTNVTFEDLGKMVKELTLEYRDRGYATVAVTIPGQSLTNGVLHLRVSEGTLAAITISGNHYFSSNNITRSLPGLRTNVMLNSKLFQIELDRANANQDRQISPEIEPGPDVDTTLLHLQVKDRLPLHAKIELNNQSSPGTPDLRLNGSATYNNLWQLEHSLGLQYSFSPEYYKTGNQWPFYDQPLVVNYSGFYRLPLGNPEAMTDLVAASPGNFGYDEATRKFRLPPVSGTPELNLYASRSAIDTGVVITSMKTLFDVPGVRKVSEVDNQQDVTVNQDLGFRLSGPLPEISNWHSTWSSGLDFKTYESTTQKTNTFQFTEAHVLPNGDITNVVSEVHSPVPVSRNEVQYLPIAFRYDGNLRDSLGTTAFGLGLSINPWYSGSSGNLQGIAGSTHVSGHWVILTPSFTRDFFIHTNWVLSIHADGQWANEPLISNEQFGAGGVSSVRGYQEGAVFGDTGWHVSLEQKTPPLIVGFINSKNPLSLRGSIYSDYAQTYLLDPQGRPSGTSLWGVGFGAVASVGSHWEARFLFSVPMLTLGDSESYQPFFNFSLTGQF